MSPTTIRRTSGVAFGVVALVLLVVSTFGYRTARRSADANQSVAHTYQVLNALERVLTTMVDAETGVRGFAVAGASRYLEPFERASGELGSSIDTVAMLTVDNPVQQRNITELRRQATTTMGFLREMVSRRQSHEPGPLDLGDREKASMDAARATLRQMRVEEQRLVQQRTDNAASADTTTRALMLGLIATAFGVLAMSFLLVDRRAVELRQANESLTERVRERTAELEQALVNAQRAQARFHRLIEAAPTAMVAVDAAGHIVLVNALTERLFGYAQAELAGQPVEMLVPERVRMAHAHDRAEFARAPQMRQMGVGRDLYAMRKDGSEVPVEIGLSPIQVDGDVWVLASIVDITERKHAEEERRRLLAAEQEARSEAVAANRSKDVFLARVSHELRTPLNALMGWARMLREGQLSPDRTRHAIVSIDRNGDVLNTLVEDLVEMSRISTGRLELDRHPLDIATLVRESINLLEPAASAKAIRVETNIEAQPMTVDGDATRLRQVVWNLLSNAIKFTPTKGHVTLHVCSAGDDVEIRVVDTGQGIAPEFLPHVFESFSQAERTGHGLGLGLAIVHQLVKAHGGRVSVTSPGVGAGTTFTVWLPTVRVPEIV